MPRSARNDKTERRKRIGKQRKTGIFPAFGSGLGSAVETHGWPRSLPGAFSRGGHAKQKPPLRFSALFERFQARWKARASGFQMKPGSRWSHWPDLNQRPADYERSSGLPLAGKQRFPDLSAGVFEEFGKPVMVFAPLSPQQFFLFWVGVWVKAKTALRLPSCMGQNGSAFWPTHLFPFRSRIAPQKTKIACVQSQGAKRPQVPLRW